jgi:thioredoxin 2
MDEKAKIVCPRCAAINLVPKSRLAESPRCGKCHRPLFLGQSLALTNGNFQRIVGQHEIPVLVDFWAAWCGYCKLMAPAFEQAAQRLEPFVRLAKINTEVSSAVAAQYKVRSLPTLILFQQNQELARHSGALTLEQLEAWVRSKIEF